ncbi:MAG: N-acetyl-gamma-glutamyl-phosphate reductase [Alphaproteobacteria bacterium]
MNKLISVAVLGSTGYVGLELVKILIRHPNVKINFLGCENYPDLDISSFDTNIKKNVLPKLNLNNKIEPINHDVVFLCLPHGASHKYVKILHNKTKVIDLSADFRLDDVSIYNNTYNNVHSCPELLNEFVYGLTEINKSELLNKKSISVPGCYPTSILLPLYPLLKNNLIKNHNIIIDSKSGYSGAGKKFNLENIKSKSDYNFYNYNTNKHRHICEIQQELNKYSSESIKFSFNPHILPVFRGMMSTIYCDLNEGIKRDEIVSIFENFCSNSKFLHFFKEDQKADFFAVQNTNNCIIKLFDHYEYSKIIIVSLIDNLIKGAAGQAIQCFNIISGLDETKSLKD